MVETVLEKEILDGKRNLHIVHNGKDPILVDRMGDVYVRAVKTLNNCLAKGLGYRNGDELWAREPEAMIHTRWKDYEKWLRVRSGPNAGTRRWGHACEFIWKRYLSDWRLDRNRNTMEYFKRVFGNQWKMTHEKMCMRNPCQKVDALGRPMVGKDLAKVGVTIKGSMLAVIAGLNLRNVYVMIEDAPDYIGAAAQSYGSWRYAGNPMETTRTEMHLLDWLPEGAICLNKKYLNKKVPYAYKGLYGRDVTKADIMTVTLIHEACHVFVAAADYFYFEPCHCKLRAEAAADSSLDSGTPIPNPDTAHCAVNADSLAWFLYYWGDGPIT